MITKIGDAMAHKPITGPAGPTFIAFWTITTPIPITNDAKKPITNISWSYSMVQVPNHNTRAITKMNELNTPSAVNVLLVGLNPILS